MYLSEMQPGPKTVSPRIVSSKELDLLSQIVEKRLGMDLNRRRQERLLQMLEKRVKESGRKDLMDYLNFVDFSPDHPEWRYLEEILTIQKEVERFRGSGWKGCRLLHLWNIRSSRFESSFGFGKISLL